MPSLTDIPNEVVLDHLLPALPLRDLVTLSSVNRQYNSLTSDPTFWRTKTLQDFTFPSTSHPSAISTSNWWKRVYLGLLRPKAYVWGSSDNNRLGGAEAHTTKRFNRFVDLPSEISWNPSPDGTSKTWSEGLQDSLTSAISGKTADQDGGLDKVVCGANGIVDLQAGGWSFTARQSDGSVWVWGQLDGTRPGFRLHSWEDKHCPCPYPTRIPLPCKAESISAGRRHLLVLDSDNLVWELRAWGRAYHHTSAELTAPVGHGTTRSPPHIVQLSTGWQHSAALTAKGEIHIWFPFSEAYESCLTPVGELSGPLSDSEEKKEQRGLKYGEVGEGILMTLPPLPSRPAAEPSNASTSEIETKSRNRFARKKELDVEWNEYTASRTPKLLEEEQRVVKVASGEDFILALKKNGEVWLTRIKEGVIPRWQYMIFFSTPKITHLTAQFRSFTTYATPTALSTDSAVYHTRLPDSLENVPDILPDQLDLLQNKGIIQIAIGDYHYAALNDKGEMFTWGQGDSGQLGQGRDRVGHEPLQVTFPQDQLDSEIGHTEGQNENRQGEESFVFSITAGGWHTGALVLGDSKNRKIPLEKQTKEVDVENPQEGNGEQQSNWPRSLWNPFGNNPTVPVPPAGPSNRGGGPVRAMPFYRVGFAGRSAHIGAGRGDPLDDTHEQASQQAQGAGRGGRGGQSIFRVGFAGRGGNLAGAGRGAAFDGAEGQNNGQGPPRGGAPIFRVGFAGRGGNLAGCGREGGGASDDAEAEGTDRAPDGTQHD
ncbi:uncharacterized protein I303_103536 [Kwoniella dejecticola CBS 10117]|uniref:F-box domain-containing protein n=1 Tax=Kwoniella dejecticola CBS 10117 TaxID=1296121 RepID=A0A1A6A709_9TREE|nr:uncharacterized protein I303_03559 [Kwoniella dejecticola CBS 10117]OBR85845.1 hypothetical protein I303_03559 [Kwoniella dejecticola CBS 10117]